MKIEEGIIPKPTPEEQKYTKQQWKEKNMLQLNQHIGGEPLGAAVVYNNKHEKHLLDVNRHDSRNITLALKTQTWCMAFTGHVRDTQGVKKNKQCQTN